MSTYLSILDSASLFELLVRLPYNSLRNILSARPCLYRITNSKLFNIEWKKHNIKIVIEKIAAYEICSKEVTNDQKVRHGTTSIYTRERLQSEYEYIQGRPIKGIEWHSSWPKSLDINYVYIGEDTYKLKTCWTVDGRISSRYMLKNDFYHGSVMTSDANGELALIEYVGGSLTGVHFEWFSTGQLKYMKTKGQSKGVFKFSQYHPNGVKASQGSTLWGYIHGRYQQWDQVGKLFEDEHYAHGNPITD
jgi:antitoxin component YwqK of YwqJK toxin-antitoxin module